MTDIEKIPGDLERRNRLADKRKDILSSPTEEVLNTILEFPQPAALVHSFPEEDFYLLIHDLGPEDAMPLLSLASARQLDFILDHEIWEKDRIDPVAVTKWFGLMMKTEPARFLRWMVRERIELLEYFLFRNIEVTVREHDQDPSEFGENVISIDNVYYYRILPGVKEETQAEEATPEAGGDREDLVETIMDTLASIDFSVYRNILLESVHVLPAEVEEEAFRLRNIRLAEKGFLPFDEAVGIYQPIPPERVGAFVDKKKFFSERMISTPDIPMRLMPADNTFSRALAEISLDDRMAALQTEFAALCNQLIVADQKKIKERKMLRDVVKKASGFISIGIDTLIRTGEHPDTAMGIILKYPLADIFRVGYGRVMELKRKAENWIHGSWFSRQDLSLNFWGEKWLGILGGMLIKRPLFFDNYTTGVLYREFESLADLKKSEKILEDIIAFDTLLSEMDIRIPPSLQQRGIVYYDNLVLTLWARQELGLSNEAAFLTLDQFRRFYQTLWQENATPRKTAESAKTSFLSFLVRNTGRKADDIVRRMGHILENMFREIEGEFGDVASEHLDPRYIRLFLVK
ncbi:MAG: DUF6178 family protein [Desulfobacterales bacterium]